MLSAQPVIPWLALTVSIVWAATELASMPKSRKQLDVPRGDWLTAALGATPVIGTGAVVAWQYLFASGTVHPAIVISGLALCLTGIGLRTWSKLVLGRFYTFAIGLTEGHRILAEGPYRFIRHPLYLGTFLIMIGFPLLTQSWAAFWLLTAPTVPLYGLRLVREEAYLMRKMGAEYRAYARGTARLIPFVW
ncbi:MAG: isoprenylcysteine carboxylmethyltransferase family protein [Burkholderiales bacterium]|nr:isoprenylcysteine carboxylmethyltransferase family protein [Burkholderiales bacterium]